MLWEPFDGRPRLRRGASPGPSWWCSLGRPLRRAMVAVRCRVVWRNVSLAAPTVAQTRQMCVPIQKTKRCYNGTLIVKRPVVQSCSGPSVSWLSLVVDGIVGNRFCGRNEGRAAGREGFVRRCTEACLVKSQVITGRRAAGVNCGGWAWRGFRYVNVHQKPGCLLSQAGVETRRFFHAFACLEPMVKQPRRRNRCESILSECSASAALTVCLLTRATSS